MISAPTASDEELLANRLGALSVALSDLLGAALPPAIAADGPDAAALNTVMQWPGMRVDELAAILGLTHSGTVRVVDRLARKGLVERRPHPADARAVAVHPSGEGQRLADRAQADRLRLLGELVADLPPVARSALAAAVDALLRRLAPDAASANRVCRLCEERVCTPDICPTEAWVRRKET
jgi:DNA-binding MarR family transcriptional regulator